MASTAINAQGSKLEVATGSTASDPGDVSTAKQAIENLISFSGFDGESQDIDTTNLDSTAKEKLVGLQDFGSFSGNWHNDYGATGQSLMRTLQGNGFPTEFLLTMPGSGGTAKFTAVVKNAQTIDGSVDAVVGGSFTLAISGIVTFT